MRLIKALRDCKQRSLTVSRKAPTGSKKASPNSFYIPSSLCGTCSHEGQVKEALWLTPWRSCNVIAVSILLSLIHSPGIYRRLRNSYDGRVFIRSWCWDPDFRDRHLRKISKNFRLPAEKNRSQLWIPRKPKKIGVWASGAEIQTSAVDTRIAVWLSTTEKFSKIVLGETRNFSQKFRGSQRQLCIKTRPLYYLSNSKTFQEGICNPAKLISIIFKMIIGNRVTPVHLSRDRGGFGRVTKKKIKKSKEKGIRVVAPYCAILRCDTIAAIPHIARYLNTPPKWCDTPPFVCEAAVLLEGRPKTEKGEKQVKSRLFFFWKSGK